MKYRIQRHKLNNISEQISDNQSNLNKKDIKQESLQNPSKAWANPTTIYDSGWFESQVIPDGGTLLDYIDLDQCAYILESGPTISNRTSRENLTYAQTISFRFRQTLNIPDNLLPYVHVDLLTKSDSVLELKGVSIRDIYYWDNSNYYRIKGDSTLLYQGYLPATTKFSQAYIDNGDILESHTSKWLYGTSHFSFDGDSYKIENGDLVYIDTIWDVSPLAGHAGYYTYKRFQTGAIDSTTSNSVTGTGTYITVTAYEDGGGNPQQTIVTTKNVTMTATMFEDFTEVQAGGTLYKNGVYQQYYYLKNPYVFYNNGNVVQWPGRSISSFSYAENNAFKLFYSSTRAKQFRFNTSTDLLIYLPSTSDYQSGSLPYTSLNVEKNPDGYPIDELSYRGQFSNTNKVFAKMSDNKYRLFVTGRIAYESPATLEASKDFDYVDEDYTQSGGTYSRVSENRPGKTESVWCSQFYTINLRLLVTLRLPKNYSTAHKVNKNEG